MSAARLYGARHVKRRRSSRAEVEQRRDATAFTLAADSVWHHATFPLTSASFVGINSPVESFTTLLGGPAEFRILSSVAPALDGDAVSGPLGIDNVAVAVPEPTSGTLLIGGAIGLLGKRRRR